MKREAIEKLLKEAGIAEDNLKGVLDQIMDDNGKDIEKWKNEAATRTTELNTANETLKGLQDDIKKYKDADIDGLKQKAEEWETKYNTDISAEQEKYKTLLKTGVLKDALKSAGVKDPDYMIFKQGGIDKFNFDQENKVIGLDDTLKPLKDSNPDMFIDENSGDDSGGMFINSGGNHGEGGGVGDSFINAFKSAAGLKEKE